MNQQTQNLITLRDKVFPIVFDMDKQGRVDLSYYESGCGTHRCLLGWYVHEVYHQKFRDSVFFKGDVIDEIEREFGENAYCLFGGKSYGSLQTRCVCLYSLLNERLKDDLPSGSEICQQIIQETVAA